MPSDKHLVVKEQHHLVGNGIHPGRWNTRISPASAAPVVDRKKAHDYEAGFLRTIADGLRHAIRDHGPITAEWIGSASKRVYSRLRGTKYAAPCPAPVQTSSDAWRRWFERLGTNASAEIVNATADLVTDERLAVLVDAKVLPSAAPVEQSDEKIAECHAQEDQYYANCTAVFCPQCEP